MLSFQTIMHCTFDPDSSRTPSPPIVRRAASVLALNISSSGPPLSPVSPSSSRPNSLHNGRGSPLQQVNPLSQVCFRFQYYFVWVLQLFRCFFDFVVVNFICLQLLLPNVNSHNTRTVWYHIIVTWPSHDPVDLCPPQPSSHSPQPPPEMFPRSNSMVTLLTPTRGIPPFIVQKWATLIVDVVLVKG